MKMRRLFPLVTAIALSALTAVSATAQDPNPPAQAGQGGGQNGGYGQRRGFGGGFGMMGGGLMGTVTATGADQYTVKTDAGEEYTVHFSSDTRMFKMPPYRTHEGGQGNGGQANGGQGGGGGWQGRGMGGNPPEPLKPTDIKVGDVLQVRGQVDESAKTVPARFIVLLDPERVAQIREMNANFGKTWLMGRVTAIDGTKVTLTGTLDNAPHSFVADENTTFRQRRDPITLADIQVGDIVRAEGAVKDGVFTAAMVNSMGAPPPPGSTTVPRQPPPASAPQ